MSEELKELLNDIQQWMLDNDAECGPQGSEIYQRITKILEKETE